MQGALVVDSVRLRQAERAHVAELTHRAFHDALTGLPNRARPLQRLERAVAAPDARAALLIVDLDGFKAVNDTLGHHAGDELLRQVADRLRAAVPGGEAPARLGGDEFAVLLPGPAPARRATEVARDINRRLGEPFRIDGRTVGIGASIGIALCPEHAADPSALMRHADTAMYRAKRGGGGRLALSRAA